MMHTGRRDRDGPAGRSAAGRDHPLGAAQPRARDRQRAAVYAAEDQVARILGRAAEFPIAEVAGSRIAVPIERRFGDIASVQRYVDGVLAMTWIMARWPAAAASPVTVRRRRGDRRAHYEPATATIAVPVPAHGTGWALREMVVLHELAHHLGGSPGGGVGTDHGPAFVGRLLALVDGLIGAEAALLLRVALADQGVASG